MYRILEGQYLVVFGFHASIMSLLPLSKLPPCVLPASLESFFRNFRMVFIFSPCHWVSCSLVKPHTFNYIYPYTFDFGPPLRHLSYSLSLAAFQQVLLPKHWTEAPALLLPARSPGFISFPPPRRKGGKEMCPVDRIAGCFSISLPLTDLSVFLSGYLFYSSFLRTLN